jgi:hypothetical protein
MGAPRPNPSGRSRVLLVAVGLFSTQVGGCFVSLDGLTGGGTPGDDRTEPQAPQTPQPSGTGGTGPTQDAGSSAPDEDAASDPADDAEDGATLVSTDPPDSAPGSGGNTMVFGGPRVTSPTIGGDTGVGFSDACPYGAALVGLNLVVDPSSPFALYQVQALCSQIATAPSGALVFGAPVPLANEGTNAGTAGSLLCAPGSVVVGWSANAEKYVHSIVLVCGQLFATPAGSGYVVGLGPSTLIGPFGGSGGNPAAAYQCPLPMVASSLAGSVGDADFVDSLQLGCVTPTWP